MSALNRTFSSRFSTRSQSNGPVSPTSENGATHSSESGTAKALAAVKDLMRRAAEDINESAISSLIDVIEHSDAIDDRKMLLEHILSFMANHPSGKIQDLLQNYVIKTLYSDLPHPPATFIGPEYAFRTADGSNNNPDYPDLGKAGTPYARSVQQGHYLPRNQLPDAGLVFDTLLRRDEFREHPAGLSSLMFSFAALVIHSVFRTDHKNVNINLTSGYVDLAPLYGNDQATQDKIRIKDGRGCLYPDTFAEDRLLLLPPATAVILVLFNRNHNYIARRLLEINERGTWVDPSTLSPNSSKLLKQEEEIFQVARLCNCAWFAAVVFSDYFSAILGLSRQGSSWSLEPFGEIREDHQLFERGRGNACSIEFNCLYRWHATTSLEDEKWIKDQFDRLFPGKDAEKLTVEDFYRTEAIVEASEPSVEHWSPGNLQRQDDGTFKDSDLANILQSSTSHHAASFGARGTPGIMKVNEIMGIESNRAWGVCSLNDFRKFLGLKTYSSFEEWNPNKDVAEAAEKLYGSIDNLELYVGLQAEDTKPVIDGAGLCPGYTISRAILADAIALTRGDRFFTEDFTPYNMTSWGFADCQRDPNGWGFGSTLGRLLLRTLPNDYNETSIYTWFPLMHPEAMEKYLKDLGKLGDYTVERPKTRITPTPVSGYVEVGEVLRDSENFTAVSHHRASEVVKGKGFFCASADAAQVQKEFISALAPSPEAIEKIGQYFYKKTTELISTASYPLIGSNTRSVNIVNDVLKLVPVYWAASEIAGITLKDKTHPSGVYTPQDLYNMLGEIYQFIFLDIESAKYMIMKQKVGGYIEELSHHIKASFGIAGSRISIAGIFGTVFGRKKSGHNELMKRLFELGHSNEQVVNEILALLIGVTVELSLALGNVVNLLLDAEEHATFRTQAKSVDVKDLAGLEAYVIEALRIDPCFAGFGYVAKKDHTVGSLTVQQGEHLFLHVANASLNDEAFPNPTTFDATRTPRERYLRPDAIFKAVGADIAPKLIVHVLRSILALENVRRGPGQSGQLQRFKDESLKHLCHVYLDTQQFRSPWPTSMVLLHIFMTDIHLLVLVHGMWGNPAHLAHMDKIIREVKGNTGSAISDCPELAVLVAETNRDESTYDGIDWGGERVAQEILEEIKTHEDQGKKVTRFSITGYSLGGLLARYVVGILHQNKFFEKVIPVNFNTVATPHIGIPRFPSAFSAIANFIGPRFLSRTGEQFFCVDKWSPKGRPLLDVLADPDHIFYQALLLFPNIRIYANAINDLTVPYVTAAIEEIDLFAEYKTNGLELEFHDEYKHVIKSYNVSSSPSPPALPEREKNWFARFRNSTPPLPPALQGPFPFNILIYALLPVLFPAFISLALVRLSISSHNSRTRLKTLEGEESNKERLAHIIAELEANVESVVLDMYDQGTPLASTLPSKGAVDGTLTQQEHHSADSAPSPYQALLTPIQRRCVQNLNKIPQLQKERAFFVDVRNSHAMIVCRDVKRFAFHLEGEGVLRHWADHFKL
ncbi:heme peroxidase [Chiua virens]|nr:heme peroxidase [Chiua virens]